MEAILTWLFNIPVLGGILKVVFVGAAVLGFIFLIIAMFTGGGGPTIGWPDRSDW